MECYSVIDINQLIVLEKKLENIEELLRKHKLEKILDLARNNILEIKKIYRELKEANLINENNYTIHNLNITISNKEIFERKVFELYTILSLELENWRNIYLNLKGQ